MLKVQLDEKLIEELFLDELRKRLDRIEKRRTLWDSNELKKQTCMSWNTIQEKFFYDERFPKFKIGGKWYFPAAEAESFLLMWIKEQKTH